MFFVLGAIFIGENGENPPVWIAIGNRLWYDNIVMRLVMGKRVFL